ncbi:MAG: PepSY-like domain-containing protein [Bacteroidota bacterium]
MKTIIATAAFLLSVNTILAQEVKIQDVPKPVIDSFNENFKGALVKSWEKENNGHYEAEFKINKKETSATFNADGTLLETEHEISVNALPKMVLDIIHKDYPGYKISEVSQITLPSGAQTFETEVKKDNEKLDLIFDSNGNFLGKETDTHESKDDKK